MRNWIVALGALALVFAIGQPVEAQSQMLNSGHDLGTGSTGTTLAANNVDRICVFCHTPHQATAASAQDPLWNHTVSSAGAYGIYQSVTMNATPTDFAGGGGAGFTGNLNTSQLCMSCHDGTIAVGSLYNDPNTATPSNSATQITAGMGAYVGTSLTDDHPVNFTYQDAITNGDLELNAAVNSNTQVTANVPLFGATVQCASCHDPHDPTNTPFLVMDNTDSALCVECHNK